MRNVLLKFRFGVSDLLCHKYKFHINYRNVSICQLCNFESENEYHVMFVCRAYENLRTELLPRKFLSNRSVMKMYLLLADDSYQFVVANYLSNMF